MEGHAVISDDVLASYAADAALEIEGVHGLVDGPPTAPRRQGDRGRRRSGASSSTWRVDWGVNAPVVGSAVQERVAEYLGRMADLPPATVDVVVAHRPAAGSAD